MPFGIGVTSPNDWSNKPTKPTKRTNTVGSTEPQQATFDVQARVDEVKVDYAKSMESVNSNFADLQTSITQINAGIKEAITNNQTIGQDSFDRYETDMREQLTNIQNSMNVQVTQAASQVDSLVGSGAFGGNVFRSQQVFSKNVSSVIANGMKNIADVTLAYRNAAEQTMHAYASDELNAILTGSQIILNATVDMVKTRALIDVDLAKNRNQQIIALYGISADVEKYNAGLRSQEMLTRMQVRAKLVMNNNNNLAQTERVEMQMAERRFEVEESSRIAEAQLKESVGLKKLDMNYSMQAAKIGAGSGRSGASGIVQAVMNRIQGKLGGTPQKQTPTRTNTSTRTPTYQTVTDKTWGLPKGSYYSQFLGL